MADMEGLGNERDWVYDMKFPKNKLKSYATKRIFLLAALRLRAEEPAHRHVSS